MSDRGEMTTNPIAILYSATDLLAVPHFGLTFAGSKRKITPRQNKLYKTDGSYLYKKGLI